MDNPGFSGDRDIALQSFTRIDDGESTQDTGEQQNEIPSPTQETVENERKSSDNKTPTSHRTEDEGSFSNIENQNEKIPDHPPSETATKVENISSGKKMYKKKRSRAGKSSKDFSVDETSSNTCTIPSNQQLDSSQVSKMRSADGDQESLLDFQSANAGKPQFVVDRPVFSQQLLDEGYEAGVRPRRTLKQSVKKTVSKCECSGKCFGSFLYKKLPFISIMKKYSWRENITGDIISGLTVGIMHIPQGMAYGLLTGLPPVYGLYTSFFPVLVYFFFGTSRHVSIGTFAVASLMVGSAVEKHLPTTLAGATTLSPSAPTTLASWANNTPIAYDNTSGTFGGGVDIDHPVPVTDDTSDPLEFERLKWAMVLTFMTGLVQLFMGIFQLGFVSTYLSDPLVAGFTTGAACHVFTSQIKHVFGVKTGRYSGPLKLVYTYIDFFKNITQTNWITLVTAIIVMVILYVVKEYVNNNPKIKPKLKMPIPMELIVVVLGTVISYFTNLETEHNVDIVGDIPTGLPLPSPPQMSLIPEVITDAVALAIVVFAISVSMGKILSKNYDYEIEANQELFAYALCNIVSSFFSSYVSSASLSRSLIQEAVGGKTQLTGVFSSALLLLVLLVIGPYFKTLPKGVLAGIIIVALKGMFKQLFELPNLWNISKIDFFIWIITFLATVFLDVDLGLLVGVVIAILTIVFRVQRPYACLLGRMPKTDIYRDISVYKEAKEVKNVKIFRFESALFFVSAEYFRTVLYKKTANPKQVKKARMKAKLNRPNELKVNEVIGQDGITRVTDENTAGHVLDFSTLILDCSTWAFVDSMGVKILKSVVNDFRDIDVIIYLANCKAGMREMLDSTGFFGVLDRHHLFVSIHDAVLHSKVHPTAEETKIDVEIEPQPTDINDGDQAPQNSNGSCRL